MIADLFLKQMKSKILINLGIKKDIKIFLIILIKWNRSTDILIKMLITICNYEHTYTYNKDIK